jgi:hypothetical protein
MKKTALLLLCLFTLTLMTATAANPFISFTQGDIHLNANGKVNLYVEPNAPKGVLIAAKNLCSDIQKVCGARASMVDSEAEAGIVIRTRKDGRWEAYDLKAADGRITITGSDRRGTIFGIYEVSRQIGVSPWYWWADAPIVHHDDIYVVNGNYTDGEPSVKYRGIFLNDEAPCLTSWVKHKFGTNYGGHEFYGHVYELLLRLKANFLWPAMWNWAFYSDDPENSRLADEMGIVVSTSHHEPMARNHQEWARHRKEYGAWNYATNKKVLDQFFREGVERMKNTEDIVTIGMRGDGDEAMTEDGTDTKLLEEVVRNQRRIISEVTGKPASRTPQVWALYKEVQDYYDAGMRVPEDVTLLVADDNWGNVRRVPLTPKERNRKGGWGLYYHVDYVGAPRNSKWLNVTPTQNMWEQLTLAQQYGLDRLWVLNVGDLKPMEYQIDFFLSMAWKKGMPVEGILNHTRLFCEQQFGKDQADEAARILNLSAKYAGRSTGEMLDARTYNLETGDWDRAVADYDKLEADALRQFVTLPQASRDCYEEIVLFPIQAMANLYRMYYAQAKNLQLAARQDPMANDWADEVLSCFRKDSLLMLHYNRDIAGGKWQGMMTQKHIGYTTWNDNFPYDILPRTKRIDTQNGDQGGFVFTPRLGYISIEAEHTYGRTDAKEAKWTVIPHMGRTLSALALMPYTQKVEGAQLSYRFNLGQEAAAPKSVKVHVITKSTLDFLNQGGLHYAVSIDGGKQQIVNFNERINTKKENVYSIFYPTVARRVIEFTIPFDASLAQSLADGQDHTLTLTPLDPGIVFEKIVIDLGGYRSQYLFGEESPYRRK